MRQVFWFNFQQLHLNRIYHGLLGDGPHICLFALHVVGKCIYLIYVSLRWAVSWGDCLGVTGWAALRCGTTLGGHTTLGGSTRGCGTNLVCVTVGEVTGVICGAVWGGWKSILGLGALHVTGNPTPNVCGRATCNLRFCLGGGMGGGGSRVGVAEPSASKLT